MQTKKQLKALFSELNSRIDEVNRERRDGGLSTVPKAKVQLLGQMSLLTHDKVSLTLSLAQTADLDALLTMDRVVKEELKKILVKLGLVYDEDSYLIWVPPGANFEEVFDFDHVIVESIDPEKNKQLIRQAIASDQFPNLVDRIIKNGGKLEDFT